MVDIHSHIVFGVDDGAKDIKESVAMLDAAASAGVTALVATPHIREADADLSLIQRNFGLIVPYAQERGINIRLGFECNISALSLDDFAAVKRFCISDSSVLLLELPFDNWPPSLERVIYGIQSAKVTVIIAHPERYFPVRREPSMLDIFSDMGCYFQINAASLNKWYGDKHRVIRYIKNMKKVDFIASDAHIAKDYIEYGKAIKKEKQTVASLNNDPILYTLENQE